VIDTLNIGRKLSIADPVHERIGRIHPNDDQRQKIIEVIDHPRKRQADQRWTDQEEEEHDYIWQEGLKDQMATREGGSE
jgi:hypothetical protein